jgi:hypothetical protein
MTTTATTRERYAYWRSTGLTAAHALSYVRVEQKQRDTLARFGAWCFDAGDCGSFAYADMTDAPAYRVRVLIGDDDHGTDWGDCEPTDAERDAARSYYVAVQVLGEDDAELYHDGIGGVDVINLPGYLQRDWEDAAACALMDHLLDGALHFAANEDSERDHWAARDVVTVD